MRYSQKNRIRIHEIILWKVQNYHGSHVYVYACVRLNWFCSYYELLWNADAVGVFSNCWEVGHCGCYIAQPIVVTYQCGISYSGKISLNPKLKNQISWIVPRPSPAMNAYLNKECRCHHKLHYVDSVLLWYRQTSFLHNMFSICHQELATG